MADVLIPRKQDIFNDITDIVIRQNGDWHFKKNKMINKDILSYFKKNLHRDEKGIFILNRYKDLQEKAYIQVKGPLLKIISIEKKTFHLENDDEINFKNVKIIMDINLMPYVFIERLKAWAMFNRNRYIEFIELLKDRTSTHSTSSVTTSLSNRTSIDVSYMFNNHIIPIQKTIQWS